jgi:Isochorismatase family
MHSLGKRKRKLQLLLSSSGPEAKVEIHAAGNKFLHQSLTSSPLRRARRFLLPDFRPSQSSRRCVESHLRELVEQGFQVAVVKDATAAPKHPEWGYGYTAALINYAYIAHAVLTTDQAIEAMTSSLT